MNIYNLVFTAGAGAVLTVFIQAFLPDDIKTRIKYYANYSSNRILRRDLRISSKIARGYDTTSECNLEDLSEELWEEFDTKPQGNKDRFVFVESRSDMEFEVDVTLEWESDSNFAVPGAHGGMEMPTEEVSNPDTGQAEKTVESIRIAVSSDIPYKSLKDYLVRSYDLVRDTEARIPANLDGRAYSISCTTGQPPLINRFLARLDFSDITARTDEGLEIEIREETIKVRNLGTSQVDEAIDKIHKVVTLFG